MAGLVLRGSWGDDMEVRANPTLGGAFQGLYQTFLRYSDSGSVVTNAEVNKGMVYGTCGVSFTSGAMRFSDGVSQFIVHDDVKRKRLQSRAVHSSH